MKNIPIILLILSSGFSFAQTKKPSFEKILDYYCGKSTSEKIYDTPKNYAHVYSIGISFDEKGLIDTLYFPEKINQNTKEIFQLDNRKIKLFKSIAIPYTEYANKIVIVPMYHYNAGDNIMDYKSTFLINLENMFPRINSSKTIILHQPIVQTFIRHVN